MDAGASLQARSSELNWVPLHEAAHAGALEAVKTLLALNAPCRPRDRSDRLPADLAREAGHMACVDVLGESTSGTVPQRPNGGQNSFWGRCT